MGVRLVVLVAFATCTFGAARADESMREHYNRGLAAYGLGNYSVAASEYERAFGLDPQPALLYDAAQAHRLAGNRHRALKLYQSYLSLFGAQASNRDEVLDRIATLKRAIAADPSPDEHLAPPPKPTPPPEPKPPAPSPLTISPSPPKTLDDGAQKSAALTTVTREPAPRKSRRGLAIGLGVAGGAVVIAGAIVLGLELGQRNPTPSLGAVTPQ